MRYKLVMSYDGKCFNGWQKQSSGRATVQGSLEKILKQVLRTPTRVIGAGRTDAGAHAVAQVAHFDSATEVPKTLLRSLNALAPEGLVVRALYQAPDNFHALASATGKTYLYRIWNAPQASVFRRDWTLWVPKKLDLEKLEKLSSHLIGEQDFKSFQTRGTPVATTVRHIETASWRKLSPHLLEFRITGEGFLKQMVRNIVGTLLYLERKNLGPQELKSILSALDRQSAKATAPAHGLYLWRVTYPTALDNQCRKI